MKTTDLFKNNRAAKKINESLAKTFGRKLNLESFDLPQLEDARNKLRTQIHTARTASGFNENLENEAFTEAQWMLDAINSEIAEREEFVANAHTTEDSGKEFAGEAETVWIGDDGEEVEGVVFYTATVDPDTGKLAVTLTGGEVTGDNRVAKVDDGMIQYLINDPDYRRDYMQDAHADAEQKYDSRDNKSEPDFDQEYNDESIGADYANPDVKMKRMGAKPLSTMDKLKMMPGQMRAMARGDSEDDLANYNKMKSKNNEAYDEPEAPDADAIARRKRLQALKDRQEDERDSYSDTKSNVRKVAGRAYGGATQKDDEVDEAAGYGSPLRKKVPFEPRERPSKDDWEAWHAKQKEKHTYKKDKEVEEERTTWNNDFYVYDPETKTVKKKFRTHKGAKQYAEANGLKVASAEYYHDSVGTEKEVEEGQFYRRNTSGKVGKVTRNHGGIVTFQHNDGTEKEYPSDVFHKYHTPMNNEEVDRLSNEVAPPGAKAERMVKHIKKGYAQGGKLSDKEKGIAYATAWKQHNKNESIQGDNMATLREGEIQQAQSIVTAKTMVDRVGRWIEELSGMENDTLLQLGDQIRDEQGQEQAKGFISSVAPAIQQALETLKGTREALATGVRTLTGEEQGAEMLGSEPEAAPEDDFGGAAEPDAMNVEVPADDFAAAEPAVGGAGDAGRMKRESVEFGNSLLKVLAG